MNTLSNVLQAARFAARKHAGQTRKGASSEPYIDHPIEVADLLANVGLVTDPDILIAGLLHDTVEDTDTTADEIADLFGETVSGYVVELTDDMSLSKESRREQQVAHAPRMSVGAKTVKLADKISNIRDVLENPAIEWDEQEKRDYVEWGVRVVEGLRGANRRLEEHFDELVSRVFERLDLSS